MNDNGAKIMKRWNVISPIGAGMEGFVYNVEHKQNNMKGAMKVIRANEEAVTMATIYLSKKYPYYVRMLDHEYLRTDMYLEWKAGEGWEDTGVFIPVFGASMDISSNACHCVYEMLEWPKEDWYNEETELILLIHMLIAIYIAIKELGYASRDLQWMYRKTGDEEYITIKYEQYEWTLPNIGFVPVIMDHGHSYVGGEQEEIMLYDLIRQYHTHCYMIRNDGDIEHAHAYSLTQMPQEIKDLYPVYEHDGYNSIGYGHSNPEMVAKYINLFIAQVKEKAIQSTK